MCFLIALVQELERKKGSSLTQAAGEYGCLALLWIG